MLRFIYYSRNQEISDQEISSEKSVLLMFIYKTLLFLKFV